MSQSNLRRLCLLICAMASSVVAAAPVTSLKFTPNGQSIVAASQAGVMQYSWPDLEAERSIPIHLANVHDLAFSPDGKSLAVAGGDPAESGVVVIFDWKTLQSTRIESIHRDSVLSMSWAGNSQLLACGSLDGTVSLLFLDGTKPDLKLNGHSKGVTAVCFIDNNQKLVSGGLDQSLRVWDVQSGELIRTLNNHTGPIHGLATRENIEGLPMIASVSQDRTVRFWQPTIGRMVRFSKLQHAPLSVQWRHGTSTVFATTANGDIVEIDSESAETRVVAQGDGEWIYDAVVSPDGQWIVYEREGRLNRLALELK